MTSAFGGPPLTFKRLLTALRHREDCSVTLQAEAGIRGLGGDPSGALYYVERHIDPDSPSVPASIRWTYIEVYHEDVVVTEGLFRIICRKLGIDEDKLRAQATER